MEEEKLTPDQEEVLDEISHIIDVEMIDRLEQQYDEECEKVQDMYEAGLGTW